MKILSEMKDPKIEQLFDNSIYRSVAYIDGDLEVIVGETKTEIMEDRRIEQISIGGRLISVSLYCKEGRIQYL